jgi:hypothetical protein
LSVHELSAAIFYALAQHRALRGLRPDGEELIHSMKKIDLGKNSAQTQDLCGTDSTMKRINSLYVVNESTVEEEEEAGDTVVWEGAPSKTNEFPETVLDETDVYDPVSENAVDLLLLAQPKKIANGSETDGTEVNGEKEAVNGQSKQNEEVNFDPPFEPVCEPVPDGTLSALLFYAPLALNFIYAECEVDMQLLAAQQGKLRICSISSFLARHSKHNIFTTTGWRLVYASLDQSQLHSEEEVESEQKKVYNSGDKPASALFAHDDQKIGESEYTSYLQVCFDFHRLLILLNTNSSMSECTRHNFYSRCRY